MEFDPQRLVGWQFGEKRQRYDARDAILYALGVGLPLAAGEGDDLGFLLEDRLRVLPSFGATLATHVMWPMIPDLAIDWVKVLHMAQAVRFENPFPPQAEVVGRASVVGLYDRGADKGSVCVIRNEVRDAVSGLLYCRVEQTAALRGNGGFGGEPLPKRARPEMPGRSADRVASLVTSPRAALIYRLSGDHNLLHVDPEVAGAAGFERPILHGLASYGSACAMILKLFCDSDVTRMKTLDLRFTGIVMPGDRLDFSFWREANRVLFTAAVEGRIVLDHGLAEIA